MGIRVGRLWARRVGDRGCGPVAQRCLHILSLAILRGGRSCIDRALIWRPSGGKAGDAVTGTVRCNCGKKIAVKPLESLVAHAAATVCDLRLVLIDTEGICWPPVTLRGLEVLRKDVTVARDLPTTHQIIHNAIGPAKEALSAAEGHIYNSVELDVLLGYRAVQNVILVSHTFSLGAASAPQNARSRAKL